MHPYLIKTMYYFTGLDVDESGNARSWIFGMGNSNGTEMLAYDQNGLDKAPMECTPRCRRNRCRQYRISRHRLFSQNSAVIFGSPSHAIPERRDLELKQGIYTLTITSGNTSRILTFNATTGEMIS